MALTVQPFRTTPVQFNGNWYKHATMLALGSLLTTGIYEHQSISQMVGDAFYRNKTCVTQMKVASLSQEQRNVLCERLHVEDPNIETIADLYKTIMEVAEPILYVQGMEEPPIGQRLFFHKTPLMERFPNDKDQKAVDKALQALYKTHLIGFHDSSGGSLVRWPNINSFSISAAGEELAATMDN